MPEWLSSILDAVIVAGSEWFPIVPDAVIAVGIAVLVQIGLVLRNERREARRAFAEAVNLCCEELENVAVLYWTGGDSETAALVGKMTATLHKMNQLISDFPRIKSAERRELQEGWKDIQRALQRDFDEDSRKIDAERVTLVVGRITNVRCKVAQIRG